MLNYHLPSESIVFTGDTLFTLGCGRLFEGDAPTMWRSLRKLKSLPGDTWVYGSHEYTQANARFALSVDPNNDALQQRAEQIDKLRAENQATVPTKLADELATNPFLRPDDPAIRDLLGMQDATDEAVFAEIRQRKDNF
jgi:hydroxyacylglutathione hydrolase